MSTQPRIAYCGPIAEPGKPARGGYESANRRLIDDLKAEGLSVREYPYAPERASAAAKAAAYAGNFALTAARVLSQASDWDILHITPLRRHFILPETVICAGALARGKKVVVDIRAGNFIHDMTQSSAAQIAIQARLLRSSHMVAVEGLEYVDFARRFTSAPIHYLPNYVTAPSSPPPAEPRDASSPVRLVFLARIVEEKGIETAIDALRSLLASGVDARLEVLGKGDAAYIHHLKRISADLPVVWHGAVNAERVRPTMRGAHFYIFPTRHDGEGHSNALTEAMAEGLVPLCADNGFNRSVVADSGRIFPKTAVGADYAGAISEILRTGEWADLSSRTRNRIDENYIAATVVPALADRYRQLMGRPV